MIDNRHFYKISERADRIRPLTIIIGGRGIGKTYGTIDYVLSLGKKFIYLRNKDTQLAECATDFGNPFKRWNRDHGRDIRIVTERKHAMIYDCTDPEQREHLGYAVALSTFENLRGVDLSDVEYVVFDEFVEKEKLKFNQFEVFANFYETVNRNRELLGEPPLIVIMLSNAQKLNNEILAGYGAIPIIERMIKKGNTQYIDKLMYINLAQSEISNAKRDTVNYKLTEGTQYYQEAIDNLFAHDSFADIKKLPINEYLPMVCIDDIYIYKHKSTGRYYCCRSASNKVPVFNSRDSLSPFLRRYGMQLRIMLADGQIDFSEFLIKAKIMELLK